MSVPCENADVLIGTVVSSSGTGTVFTPLQLKPEHLPASSGVQITFFSTFFNEQIA